ncbi:MAG: hypothetical protein ACYDCL_17825 [Myxococcales bacterium]
MDPKDANSPTGSAPTDGTGAPQKPGTAGFTAPPKDATPPQGKIGETPKDPLAAPPEAIKAGYVPAPPAPLGAPPKPAEKDKLP